MTAEVLAGRLVALAAAYLAIGFLFSIAFVVRGVEGIDPAAKEGTWGFRLAILPGVAALWPILARRWLRGTGPPTERNSHRERSERGGRL